jgi:hypothetical protein
MNKKFMDDVPSKLHQLFYFTMLVSMSKDAQILEL